jgi:hypothetical protein
MSCGGVEGYSSRRPLMRRQVSYHQKERGNKTGRTHTYVRTFRRPISSTEQAAGQGGRRKEWRRPGTNDEVSRTATRTFRLLLLLRRRCGPGVVVAHGACAHPVGRPEWSAYARASSIERLSLSRPCRRAILLSSACIILCMVRSSEHGTFIVGWFA